MSEPEGQNEHPVTPVTSAVKKTEGNGPKIEEGLTPAAKAKAPDGNGPKISGLGASEAANVD